MATHSTKRPAVFGEVLYDQFPDGSSVLGGAPFNVAWNLQAFGLNPLFISRIGNDSLGHQIREAMQQWGMDTIGLQIDPKHQTGTVDISIKHGEPSFNIVPQRAYDYIDAEQLPALDNVGLLYHGSLALRNTESKTAFSALASQQDVPTFIDVNLRSPWWRAEDITPFMQRARWIKLNENELTLLAPAADSVQSQALALQQTTGADLILVTRGEHGALACLPDGAVESIVPNKNIAVTDTVGAGDAFASVTIAGLLKGWDPVVTLHRAQNFASAVVGLRGATTTDQDFYRSFLGDLNP